ncbi:adenylate/guanylate cyclase domain-containing protein [Methylocystis sp. B8]|uniref:adenylate/guanylate cyclase domain-containing protein n=1 Tax=Methylocystis sp. B8 TaxID=544938 RepID=UPI0010FF4479|nr:adenylate/guanylate cyclase domain-containing protein [Methylocystis sp. B8]TLG77914.1 HAMP domain-containing protein [Methylocystis sp. B8]
MRLPHLSFASRLVALVATISVGATLVASTLLAWSNYRTMLAEAHENGEEVARLLARSASLAREIPLDVERMISQHMIVSAELLALFVEAAEKAGMTSAEINNKLTAITEKTILNEFWVTDEKGYAYIHGNKEADFLFSASVAQQPQAHEFWPLLTGEKDRVVQDARKREVDNEHFKYVGVRGSDKPRIVQVGYNARFLKKFDDQIGLPRVIDNLLGGGDIDAIFVFDKEASLIASPNAERLNGDRSQLTFQEIAPVRTVIATGQSQSVHGAGKLSVISPINGENGGVIGAAVVRMPTTRLNSLVASQIETALAIALAATLLGGGLAAWIARKQTAPVVAIAKAANDVERRAFSADELSDVEDRQDEVGHLARVFKRMALDFLNRERTLDALVTHRTQALEDRNAELERLSARLSKYLSPQLYSTLFKNNAVASISAKRKKLTVFFSDVVGFSQMAESLESEDVTRMLNDFLNEMANLALSYGATIDKYIGDAVMIFFGDPETRGVKEDAVACLLMALDMQAMTRELERRWREYGLDQRFEIRIGVNTGYCTVGDFGSQERMEYTIIGHQVNLAARLEEAAAPGAILISHETMVLVEDVIEVQEQTPIHVKGVSGSIRTYRAIGKKTPSVTDVIREEREGLRVDVDLTKANKDEAISLLKAAIERIRSDEGGTSNG